MSRNKTWDSALTVATLIIISFRPAQAANWALIGWNNLGMHCIDADYSVFSLLPPYNTINAQLIDPSGNLVTDPAGITVTYNAIADPDGPSTPPPRARRTFGSLCCRSLTPQFPWTSA
jgi:hypothetical protein